MLDRMLENLQLAYSVFAGWHALGHEEMDGGLARFVRDARTGGVYDASFAHAVRASSTGEIEAFLAQLEEVFAGFEHRHVLWDPQLPPACEARLVLEGYRPQNALLSLVLSGELTTRGPAVEIRPLESEADWQSIAALKQLDHDEQVARGLHDAWPDAVSQGLLAHRRVKHPAVRFHIARIEGVDCSFFSAWPGVGGMGMVEDLFTHPAYRGRGIGTALVAACVDDARARGARTVLVNPLLEDTPKRMYAALGFEPLCVQRSYVKD